MTKKGVAITMHHSYRIRRCFGTMNEKETINNIMSRHHVNEQHALDLCHVVCVNELSIYE